MRKFTCIKDFTIGVDALVLKVGDGCLIEFDRLYGGGFILKTLPDINGESCEPWHIGMMFLNQHFIKDRSTTIKKLKESIKKLKDEKIYLH